MLSRKRALATIAGGVAAASAVGVPTIARGASAIQVAQIGRSVAFFPLFVAEGEGFFKDEGLDVTITPFASGTLVGTAVTSNSVDIGCSVITDVFALLKANRPVKLVGSLVDGYYVDVVASTQLLASTKITRASKLKAKILALKGKKIGITGPGSGTQALVDYLLKSVNLDPTRDVELVNVGADQASIVTTLKTGRIDAVSFAWPLSMIADQENAGKAIIMPAEGDVPSMRGQVQGVVYVKPDTLTRRESETVAFVRAVGRAETLLHKDEAKRRAYYKKYSPASSDAAIDALLAAYVPALPVLPRIGVVSYEKALNFHRITGFAGPSGNSYQEIVSTSTIDRALRA